MQIYSLLNLLILNPQSFATLEDLAQLHRHLFTRFASTGLANPPSSEALPKPCHTQTAAEAP